MQTHNLPPWPERAALFLDLDGTLLEFADHPDQAVASQRLQLLLPRLEPLTEGAVAFITGRTIDSLDRLLQPHEFPVAGIHGLERRRADAVYEREPIDDYRFGGIRDAVRQFAARHHGLIYEDKKLTCAVHYRRRPDLEQQVLAFAESLRTSLSPDFVLLRGKMVIEVKAAQTDKGKAIARFMAEPPFAGRTPVFIGDDVTDEAGFELVNRLRGVSIKVDAADTVAQWRLSNVDAVLSWLEFVVAGAAVQSSPKEA